MYQQPQQGQTIEQLFNQAWNGQLRYQEVMPYQNFFQQVYGKAYQLAAQQIQNLSGSGGRLSANEVVQIAERTIRACFYNQSWMANQPILNFAPDYLFLISRINGILDAPPPQQQMPASGGWQSNVYGAGGNYQQPQQYGVQPNNGWSGGMSTGMPQSQSVQSSMIHNSNTQQPQMPSMGADLHGLYSDVPDNKPVNDSEAALNEKLGVPASTQPVKKQYKSSTIQENAMDINDHLQQHTSAYDFATPVGEMKKEPLKPKVKAAPITDLRSWVFRDEKYATAISGIYSLQPDSRTKICYLELTRNHAIPTYMPTLDLQEDLFTVSKQKTFEEMVDVLLDINERHNVKGIIDWVDNWICYIIETMLKQIYGVDIYFGFYFQYRSAITAELAKHGAKDAIHEAICAWLKAVFKSSIAEDVEFEKGDKKVDGLIFTVCEEERLLLIPKQMRFKRSTNEIWIEDFDDDTMMATFDKVWEMNKTAHPFIIMIDKAGMRYRVWRCTVGNNAPSTYFIEEGP